MVSTNVYAKQTRSELAADSKLCVDLNRLSSCHAISNTIVWLRLRWRLAVDGVGGHGMRKWKTIFFVTKSALRFANTLRYLIPIAKCWRSTGLYICMPREARCKFIYLYMNMYARCSISTKWAPEPALSRTTLPSSPSFVVVERETNKFQKLN